MVGLGHYMNTSVPPQGNSAPVHMSPGNTKPLHYIESRANVDGWSVSDTSPQFLSHHIVNTFGMLKLNFNMLKGRKTQPAVSERSKGMAD